MSNEKSFAELRKIAAALEKSGQRQNEAFEMQTKQLQNAELQLEVKRKNFALSQNADVRRVVEQTVDFALRSLPWWNRSISSVMKRAALYENAIKAETLKIVSQINLPEPDNKEE